MMKPIYIVALLSSLPAYGFFLDGKGHYAAKGESHFFPGAAKDRGTHQAIDQDASFEVEVRANERASFYSNLHLFTPRDGSYMGDQVSASSCREGVTAEQCKDAPQNSQEPGYAPLAPTISTAFVRYALEQCLLEVGRRPRQWGMGLFLDAGQKPFSHRQSVFDGISCEVNLQKEQSLGFAVGYDKLAETGRYIKAPEQTDDSKITFGPTNPNDDVDQFFLMIQHDDRRNGSGGFFNKQIGFYAAKVTSNSASNGGLATDMSFLDLFTSFFFPTMTWTNEFLFRLGKTADPAATRLGGADDDRGEIAVNRMDAIGFSGKLDYILSRSGQTLGPERFRQGDAKEHGLFLEYSYAPGDSEGYYSVGDDNPDTGAQHRSKKAKAIAFHENFKPALILFNGRQNVTDLRIDGIYDTQRVMNTQIWSLGYRYEDLAVGHFEAKLIAASLLQGIPSEVKAYHYAQSSAKKPVGYFGKTLGYELDLKYSFFYSNALEIGFGAGALIPGSALRVGQSKPSNSFLIQSSLTFLL